MGRKDAKELEGRIAHGGLTRREKKRKAEKERQQEVKGL